jgi:hypothetical protein
MVSPRARWNTPIVLVLLCATALMVDVAAPASARAADLPVSLGSAADFAVLAGAQVSNTGPTVATGDLGASPGYSVTGFPPGMVNGSIHLNDSAAQQAMADLTSAYTDAESRLGAVGVDEDLGGATITPGVYDSVSGTFTMAGTLTLDAQGDPNAVFIFQTDSLTTGSNSIVSLTGGAQSCNVFWQVDGDAVIADSSIMRGDVMAANSIAVDSGAQVDGRAMAINDTVYLDTATVTRSACAVPGVLSITAPEFAYLGQAAPGGTMSGTFGNVTVTDDRMLSTASWVATVSTTNFISSGNPPQVVDRFRVSYWSGPASATSGVGTFQSGQFSSQDAQNLNSQRTAYTLSNGAGSNSATWQPRLIVQLPVSAVVGTYSGTITFSVG